MYEWKYPSQFNGIYSILFNDPYEWRDPRKFFITVEVLESLRNVPWALVDHSLEAFLENVA